MLRAAVKVADVLPPTPLLPADVGGRIVWCKAESLQPMGAFKIRGAWHRLTDLTEAERAGGVVAFSSGNHALGIAWAARRLGIAATVVMPHDAPAAKRAGTEALGATVVGYNRTTESREAIAAALSTERGAVLVPSFRRSVDRRGAGNGGRGERGSVGPTAGPDRRVLRWWRALQRAGARLSGRGDRGGRAGRLGRRGPYPWRRVESKALGPMRRPPPATR